MYADMRVDRREKSRKGIVVVRDCAACIDMCVNMRVDMCVDKVAVVHDSAVYIDMRIDVCIDMGMDLCIDM